MRLKGILALFLVGLAVLASGCINTGSGITDRDNDNRTGINEIGDEDETSTNTTNSTTNTTY